MARNHDAILLEAVKTHRNRLLGAFLTGELDGRRLINDNRKRFTTSIVLAAVACAVCVGVSFVSNTLAEQQNKTQQTSTQQSSSSETP